MRWIVRLNHHRFLLNSSAIADVKRRGDFAFLAGRDIILLQLRRRAAARGVNRLNVNGDVTGILIFEMSDRLFVANGRMQLERRLLPFQFRPHGRGKKDRQGDNADETKRIHFFE